MIAIRERLFEGKQIESEKVTFPPDIKLAEIERIVIVQTLQQKKFNRTHTAKSLGIGIRTLQRKLKQYGLQNWGLTSDTESP